MNATELIDRFESLPSLSDDGAMWTTMQSALRKHVLSEEIDKFLNWSTIISAMFVGDAPYIRSEWSALEMDNWSRWSTAIAEDESGNPKRLSFANWTSGNLVHQAYHLLQWENHTGRRISELESIVEIGGGYGAMAKVARRAGFEGRYTIYDLPEYSLLQRYYLAQCGIRADCKDAVLSEDSSDLLIALWSLTEMENDVSDVYLRYIQPRSYLVGVNDVETSKHIEKELSIRNLIRIEIDHLPGNFYLIG